MYLSTSWFFCVSWLRIVLVVRKEILMAVFLNKLVMNVVSFPIYVNVAHFCVCVFVCVCVDCFCSFSFGWCGFYALTGY